MKRVIAFCALLGASTTLAACDFSYPMVDSAIAPEAMRADYPRLVPITGALTGVDAAPTRANKGMIQDLDARVANLRARAAVLRRPVVDTATLSRMRAAVTRLQG